MKQTLQYRGILESASCDLCSSDNESISYDLRDCSVARNFWLKDGILHSNTNFFSSNILDWIIQNACNKELVCWFRSIYLGNLFFCLECGDIAFREINSTLIRWEKPGINWVKLNSRDNRGNWVEGYARA